ncbi:MAG: hypothetical protein MR531_14580 [Lachnospiraceae bacterium]|nr:hypothetical protein [Lachnospiraceae bacterium]
MENGIFNNGFGTELDKLIEKRLLNIESLEERKQTKDIMTEVFKEITHYTQDAYQRLETKLCAELQKKDAYPVITGIVERKDYDVTNDEMFPMYDEDMKEPEFRIEDLLECLKEGKAYFIYSIFVQADYKVVRNLAQAGEHFSCSIKTQYGEYKGTAYVEPQKKYFSLLNDLFQVYQLNGVEWRAICAPYLYKIFDVYIDTADVPDDEIMEQITVDFKEYAPYIRYHMIPIWNMERIHVVADIQPEAFVDRVHYRHTINRKRLRQDSEYLVSDKDMEILEVERDKELTVITTEQDIKKWEVYRLSVTNTRMYDYPLMSNMQFSLEKRISKTTAGIYKFCNRMGFHDYVSLKEISFPEKCDDKDNYSMNDYIDNEIKIPQTDAIMLLEFESRNQEDYLVKDIISYIVTAIQREFREYNCVGKIVS